MGQHMVTNSDLLHEIASELTSQGIASEREVPSASYVTYRCGGSFGLLVQAHSSQEVVTIAGVLSGRSVPTLVVGRGSNLLVADDGFHGVALQLAGSEFDSLVFEDHAVQAGGVTALPVLARRSVAAGFTGLEFYVGIPGTVGGAIRMNAGGHGQETQNVLESAEIISLTAGTKRTVTPLDLGFGYRSCNLADADLVVSARFRAEPASVERGTAQLDEIVKWRREHQPGGANAGSVFRNPPGDSAGRLVEAAGCKGLRVGGAWVSEKHANFIQADATAKAADVLAVARLARERVRETFGVELQWELKRVGFEDHPR